MHCASDLSLSVNKLKKEKYNNVSVQISVSAWRTFCQLLKRRILTIPTFKKASGHLLEGLYHLGDSINTPWLLPARFLVVQTETTLTLAIQLGLQFHLCLICAVYLS